jgi:hypothetical protein
MISQVEYYRLRLAAHDAVINSLTLDKPKVTNNEPIIKNRKRKYEEAFGYAHDYEVVQDPMSHQNNRGLNWKDGYLENLANKK